MTINRMEEVKIIVLGLIKDTKTDIGKLCKDLGYSKPTLYRKIKDPQTMTIDQLISLFDYFDHEIVINIYTKPKTLKINCKK